MLTILEALMREPRSRLVSWLRCQHVQLRNPGLVMRYPIAWIYDDVWAITIGGQVHIGAFSQITVRARSPHSKVSGRLIIQDRVSIDSHANLLAAGGEIFIGRNSILAQRVSLVAVNHSISIAKPYRDLPWDESRTGVHVGENVWIGNGAIVLPGCNIGDNSIIGAGSVVTKNIPPNKIWAGVPAREIRSILE